MRKTPPLRRRPIPVRWHGVLCVPTAPPPPPVPFFSRRDPAPPPEPAVTGSAASGPSPSVSGRRVLVADDEKNIRLALTETLDGLGAAVDEAADGQEALDKLAAGDYDLVLCDFKMPRADGMAVLRGAAAQCPDTPVVMITAHGDVETAVEAMQAGAAGFVEKPFTPDEIRAVAARHLDRDAGRREEAESYGAHVRHAREAIGERRLDAAYEHARQALALGPDRPEPFNLLGVVTQLRMDVPEAQRYFRSRRPSPGSRRGAGPRRRPRAGAREPGERVGLPQAPGAVPAGLVPASREPRRTPVVVRGACSGRALSARR